MSMNQFQSGQPVGYSGNENDALKPPATRGRPSNLEKGCSDNLPAIVTGYLFGDALAQYSRQQVAEKLDECIVKNSRQSQRCRTYVALALYTAKTLRTFQDSGYRNWEDYIKAMVVRHQSFGTPRHAGRYIHAVETWIVKYGYEPALLEKYGPSALGEIAESGVVRDAKDAQAWLRLLESHAVGDLRKVIKEQREMLTAREGGQKQLAQFDHNSDEDEEPVPTNEGATLAPPVAPPQDPGFCPPPSPDPEDEGGLHAGDTGGSGLMIEILESTRTWDDIYMAMCVLVASKSKDPSSKFGAVIVGPDHEVRSTGFNGFPRGVVERELSEEEVDALNERYARSRNIPGIPEISIPAEDRWENRAHKYKLVVHAEANAILNAARVGIPTNGCTMYVNGFPCDRCAGAIVQAGISRLVFKHIDNGYLERWAEFLPYSLLMLREAGVIVES